MSSAIVDFLKRRGIHGISIKESLYRFSSFHSRNLEFVLVKIPSNKKYNYEDDVKKSLSNYDYLLKFNDPSELRVYFFNEEDKRKYLSEKLITNNGTELNKLHATTEYCLFQIDISMDELEGLNNLKSITEALSKAFGDIVDIRANSFLDYPISLKYVRLYIKRKDSKEITSNSVVFEGKTISYTATRITDYVPI
ncbi:hypothetical protein AX774_g5683 [Zancudomyces culisetae]|uniref:Uncharacterized protein n=1 Tax=Zancudomyces culisetae TaxID=1213189 RepID=A0A1R1PJ44_ZANCU|nr:hypothetical protein AX774_g5683 [Zancudomyces culisetae]|eukprot:OMH80872.1 hypothetical protein AX774_g5683 [Zancudomyces culisetae]